MRLLPIVLRRRYVRCHVRSALAPLLSKDIDMGPKPDKPRPKWQRPGRLSPRWLAVIALSLSGCTTFSEYIHNGFKVGPEYQRPPAPVAEHWIDSNDVRVRSEAADDSHWWTVFNDPVLSDLVQTAYRQNLNLREAGSRV